MCDAVQAVTQIYPVQVARAVPHCSRADGGEDCNDRLFRKSCQLHSRGALARFVKGLFQVIQGTEIEALI